MAVSPRKKLLLVDDDPQMHVGMRFILGDDYELTCVFSGEEAVASASSEIFPAVILDLQMRGLSGLETMKLLLKEENAPPKVIILTGHDTKESAIAALNLGAFRYLVKPFRRDELQENLDAAYERYNIEVAIRSRSATGFEEDFSKYGLSKRQHEIAKLVVQGDTNRGIAERLKISPRTVEKHMQRVFSALNVSSRAKLAALVRKN